MDLLNSLERKGYTVESKLVEVLIKEVSMIIQLTDNDLQEMPSELCSELLKWLQPKQPRDDQMPISQAVMEKVPEQLILEVNGSVLDYPTPDYSRVRVSQLFDMGLIEENSQVHIWLKRNKARQLAHSYVMSIQISSQGTLTYEGEKFDKPSPLAAKVNGGAINGWEYIEIKRHGQWICLNELRKIWRNNL